jgi:hypothetical protein
MATFPPQLPSLFKPVLLALDSKIRWTRIGTRLLIPRQVLVLRRVGGRLNLSSYVLLSRLILESTFVCLCNYLRVWFLLSGVFRCLALVLAFVFIIDLRRLIIIVVVVVVVRLLFPVLVVIGSTRFWQFVFLVFTGFRVAWRSVDCGFCGGDGGGGGG